jgi:hypothetical protein
MLRPPKTRGSALIGVLPDLPGVECHDLNCDGSLEGGARSVAIAGTGHLMHCTENPIYAFPEMKLRGLVPNSYIHVSVSVHILRIGLPIWLQQNRQTDPGNI